jgi:hypothetical protein
MENRACKVCNAIVYHNGKRVNQCIIIADSKKDEYVCSDCADIYFCDLEIKYYKKWCKQNNRKIDFKVIKKIQQNQI